MVVDVVEVVSTDGVVVVVVSSGWVCVCVCIADGVVVVVDVVVVAVDVVVDDGSVALPQTPYCCDMRSRSAAGNWSVKRVQPSSPTWFLKPCKIFNGKKNKQNKRKSINETTPLISVKFGQGSPT